MSSAREFYSFVKIITILAILTIVRSAKSSASASATQVNVSEEGERLAGFLYEQFRRDLESGAGQQSKLLENNGLLVIRGIKFRTVIKGMHVDYTRSLSL